MSDPTQTSETLSDVLDPARMAALQVLLDLSDTAAPGQALAPFFHQIYFWAPQRAQELGRDGHPRVGGGLIPDLGLPRRMWAGGRLAFRAPLRAGQLAQRRSVVETVTRKTGRTGPLGFVTLRHEISQNGALAVCEWQDLVYREDPKPDAPAVQITPARRDETHCIDRQFDATQLFRYSALTFNGHRIHYDLDYAREVEGYAGLVVHGPLLAQYLMLMACDLMGPLTGFAFRARSPLVHTETAEFCANGSDFWVRGPDGRVCMTATATPL
ncbi:MAG: MaoC family dehydratase N-terminal domain-containing protein [Sedimentitalea sp.]